MSKAFPQRNFQTSRQINFPPRHFGGANLKHKTMKIKKYEVEVEEKTTIYGDRYIDEAGGILIANKEYQLGIVRPVLKVKVIEEDWRPGVGESYYWASPFQPELYRRYTWVNDHTDNNLLSSGVVFPCTEQGKAQAIELSKKILNFIKQ